MQRLDLRPFFGWTILLAVVYAPIVAYTLWMHFKNYAGPTWLLLLPVFAAVLSGFADRKLSVLRCAVLLSGTAYAIAVADALREVIAGAGKWYEVPMTVVFAAFWFATAILVPTVVLVMSGRALWSRLAERTR
jgi:hypothetical protein